MALEDLQSPGYNARRMKLTCYLPRRELVSTLMIVDAKYSERFADCVEVISGHAMTSKELHLLKEYR